MRCHTSIFVFLALFGWPTTAILIPNAPPPESLSQVPCTQENIEAKDLDLVLYGVTGFTGKLAAFYLAQDHPEISRWAIAGRTKLKVDYMKSRLGSNKTNVESIVIGLKNVKELSMMAKRARTIINFAGPYEEAGGEALIFAALQGCAHYVDISTETVWKAKMLKKYGSTAQARGVAIVQSAGFASLASDFLAMSAIQNVAKVQQEPPSNVMVLWTRYNGGVSGGQTASKQYEMLHYGPLTDAYILAPETAVDKKVDWTIDGMEDYGLHDGVGKLSKSNLASFDCPVIRRSIKLKFPDAPISVQQAAKATLFVEQMAFLNNQTRNRLEGAVVSNPSPGQGPPRWVRRHGSFTGVATASGRWASNPGEEEVKSAKTIMDGHGDPSFMGSAIMATEVALGLALNGPDTKTGGYLTPTIALGTEALERRLTAVKGGNFVTITHT